MANIVAHAMSTGGDTGSYLDHVTTAAEKCLAAAGLSVDSVDALINVGVYRDANLFEPAIAALIQKRIGMGLEYAPGRRAAFSFDLMNGAGGLLDAASVAAALLSTSEMDHVLLVCGDTHPSTAATVEGFPYTPAAGALLLGRSESGSGFGRLHTISDSAVSEPFGYWPINTPSLHGRSSITIRQPESDALAPAVRVIGDCVDAESLDLSTAVLVVNDHSPVFADRLAAALGIDRRSVVGVAEGSGTFHTAGVLFAYDNAIKSGNWSGDRPLLFVSAHGPTASCISYRDQRPTGKEQ